ncbi:cuticular protein CPF2 isoform X2 [Lasioglossum baleicum]|uniref:cuticular protein CPF2 isoform X2 n=1 Tax=Lasioglossum baleicum TaxID=434251 RepID=UPI003FCDD81A
MYRFLVICGCLLAVAQAGVIGGGLLAATAPAALAVQPAALPLSAATVALPSIATSTSNIIRGIGNLGPVALGGSALLAPGLTTAIAGPALSPLGLHGLNGLNGLALNGLGAVKVL